MEDDEEAPRSIPPWVELEYAHMRILAGEPARLYFTHLSKPSRASLSTVFAASDDRSLAKTACFDLGVHEMIRQSLEGISSDQVCLLDPKAEAELSPEDGDSRFQWFLFGVSAAEGALISRREFLAMILLGTEPQSCEV
jgi:ribosome biogenesis SPOUT family RNA methylase Rps3